MNIKEVGAKPGIWLLIHRAKSVGLRLGLCTSSSDYWVELVLEKVWAQDQPHIAIDRLFDVVVNGGRVRHKKLHPEPYQSVASRLNTPPSRCLVIEDSTSGIASAKAVGCYCIGLIAPYNRYQYFSSVDQVVHDLEGIRRSL